jgi:hypothetical protein
MPNSPACYRVRSPCTGPESVWISNEGSFEIITFYLQQEQREVAVDGPVATRATASDRMCASRERRRRGSVLVEIEVDAGILDRLIGIEMLTMDQCSDRAAAVGAALLRSVRAERSPTGRACSLACWRRS